MYAGTAAAASRRVDRAASSSSLGIATVEGRAGFRHEILDDRQCVLHGTKALLARRKVARAKRQIRRLLLAGQALLGSADIVRKGHAGNGRFPLGLGQSKPGLGGAPHYRAVVGHEFRLPGG